MRGQQVQNGGLPGVLGGGEQSGGLVEHQVNQALPGEGLPVHQEGGVQVIFFLRGAGGPARRLDPPRPDEQTGLFSGPAARIGQNFV